MHHHEEYLPLRNRSSGDYIISEDDDISWTPHPITSGHTMQRRIYQLIQRLNPWTSSYQRHYRMSTLTILRISFLSISCLVMLLVSMSILNGILYPSYANPPPHYRNLEELVQRSSEPGRGNPNSEKIFIAANIIQADLIKGHWGTSVLRLIDLLGHGNVFISVFENDSGLETQNALQNFKTMLPCQLKHINRLLTCC
jgi:hypothetical protein